MVRLTDRGATDAMMPPFGKKTGHRIFLCFGSSQISTVSFGENMAMIQHNGLSRLASHLNNHYKSRNVTERGFTLIELIIVIVILGILAVTAIPRFMDLGSEARIAALNTLRGSTIAASNMVNLKAAAQSLNLNAASGVWIQIYTTGSGAWVQLVYGYPAANQMGGLLQAQGGATYSFPTGQIQTATWTFRQGCTLTYNTPSAAGNPPTLVSDISGC